MLIFQPVMLVFGKLKHRKKKHVPRYRRDHSHIQATKRLHRQILALNLKFWNPFRDMNKYMISTPKKSKMGPFQKDMRNNIIFQPVIFRKMMLDFEGENDTNEMDETKKTA